MAGDRKEKSSRKLFDGYFFLWYNKQRHMAKCLRRENMAGVVKWLTRRIVAPLRVGSSPTTRPIFFCLKSDIVGLYGGIAKR